ncbi:hypothetical protein [Trebonia sp.]|uniref:hypothetical protein n=1 Tax=Trebonia sp. TaxID=2767075 RepID=UPI0026282AB7|nr:hypothetical protein [Trebonia sp.]
MNAQTNTSTCTSLGSNLRQGAIFPFALRAPRSVAAVRAIAGVFLIVLGAVFCGVGSWWGLALFVAAAANLELARRLVITSRAR